MSQTVLCSQAVDFVGGAGPAIGVQHHLKVVANSNLKMQPSGMAPHLDDVGLRGHWIVDAIDVEDDGRQGLDSIT